jgi:hypothetical protein
MNENQLYKWNIDIEKLKLKSNECIDVSKNLIAIGTKNGTINLHSSTTYNKLFLVPSTEFGTDKPYGITNLLFSKDENYLG